MHLKIPDLEAHLQGLLEQVPAGKVTSYRALALALGDAVATRWVGSFLRHHPHAPQCVCHRVVRSTGQVGNYVAGNSLDKQKRLEAEGVEFHRDKINLLHYGFTAFVSERPLDQLRQLQTSLLEKVSIKTSIGFPEVVAGVDVSYASTTEGVAAYALLELKTGKLLWHTKVFHLVKFPYVSSYLAFRELPLLLKLLHTVKEQDRLAPLLLVDGTGILHPRRTGIASHLGVLADIPTVGITKRLLSGRVRSGGMTVGETRSILHDDRIAGVALKSKANSNPVYLSPGHGVDVEFVQTLAPQLIHGHRLPEALYWADRLSRETARQKSV